MAGAFFFGREIDNTGTSFQQEIERDRRNTTEDSIRFLLEPLFDEVNVSSNLRFNWERTEVRNRTFESPLEDSEAGLLQRDQSERTRVINAPNPQAGMGIEENAAAVPGYVAGGAGEQSSIDTRAHDRSFALNEREQITQSSEGDLIPEDSSISVIAYTNRVFSQAIMEDEGRLPAGQTWNEFRENLQFTRLPDDEDLRQAIISATGISDVTLQIYEIPIIEDRVEEPTDWSQILVFAILAALIALLAYGLIKATKPDDITEVEPELSVEDLLISTQIEEAKEDELARLEEISFNKISEARKQIEKFVTEKPEAVAQLLRNWLNEEWE
jgi:flagellar M-ring protein FliF